MIALSMKMNMFKLIVPSAKGEHSCNIRRSGGWHIGLDINFDEPVPLTADVLVKLYQRGFLAQCARSASSYC